MRALLLQLLRGKNKTMTCFQKIAMQTRTERKKCENGFQHLYSSHFHFSLIKNVTIQKALPPKLLLFTSEKYPKPHEIHYTNILSAQRFCFYLTYLCHYGLLNQTDLFFLQGAIVSHISACGKNISHSYFTNSDCNQIIVTIFS